MSLRVLVIDDSALIREVLSRTLVRDGDIEVVGQACDPIEAREKIKQLNPDVVTLDIEMPNMNGLEFLKRLMRLRPMPVIMVSTLTHRGASETVLALELGAVDFVPKPRADHAGGFESFGAVLREKVRAAAMSDVRGSAMRVIPAMAPPPRSAPAPIGSLIAIGASTGGVEAIRALLSGLPSDCPPIVIAQHMPGGFTARFAARLDEVTPFSVVEAEDGMVLQRGHAYVAKGDHHLGLVSRGGMLKCAVTRGAPESGHRPSVDHLFTSVAKVVGPLAVGAILTGMGRDGATGLRLIKEAGGHTIGQSEGSALVYGMPRVAFEEGAVIEQAPLERIAGSVVSALARRQMAA